MSDDRSRLEHPKVRAGLWVAGSLALVALAIGAIFLTTSIYELVTSVRATQVDNTARQDADRQRDVRTAATAADAARSADRIEDCTTPGRQCFEAAQRRLGRTVGTINDYALAAAYCADQAGEQSVAELQRCIVQQITARQPQENTPR